MSQADFSQAAGAPQPMSIAVRTYAVPPKEWAESGSDTSEEGGAGVGPSDLVLVFDTETQIDRTQSLRFGVYQLWRIPKVKPPERAPREPKLVQAGLFHHPELPAHDLNVLVEVAQAQGLRLMTVEAFAHNIFYGEAYDKLATVVGFNLPFDLTRLAIRCGKAQGKVMRGGFSAQLSKYISRPRVQLKHVTPGASLIQFGRPRNQETPRGMRKRGLKVAPNRGFFVDAKTAAGALYNFRGGLGPLSKFLKVAHPKTDAEDGHGAPITPEYVAYAINDVTCTFECYLALAARYASYGLATPLHRIYSEASLGKAHLDEMGIAPWQKAQADFPPELIGVLMSTFYGARTEVRLRRKPTQVAYVDFTSMYPSVCAKMGLWWFAIAAGVDWRDGAQEVRELLAGITPDALRDPAMWQRLAAIVRLKPNGARLPIRAKYAEEGQYTIGLNHLHSPRQGLWYTLADVIVSKLLTGETPEIEEALIFTPREAQPGLKPINILGDPAYRVDPYQEDFFKRAIELRAGVKDRMRKEPDPEAVERLNAEQENLKLCANSTAYGIYAQLNTRESSKPIEVTCYGPSGAAFKAKVRTIETPGPRFHPLLATLITGAARLMLALAETRIDAEGLGWVMCDTDSMAIAKPDDMDQAEFYERAQQVCAWFDDLNPYDVPLPLLKVEDVNRPLKAGDSGADFEPLYILAISAKRYAMYNLDADGRPILRKASAHGLGHYLAPYGDDNAPEGLRPPSVSLDKLGVSRWHHDLWLRIIEAALSDRPNQVDLSFLDSDAPAASRLGITSPRILGWLDESNKNLSYDEAVKPANFLLHFQIDPHAIRPGDLPPNVDPFALRPIAPFDRDPAKAMAHAIDRDTKIPIPAHALKSLKTALAQYHLHPESKFANADYLDSGVTELRQVEVCGVVHIGKEANRLDEQIHGGLDEEALIEYGLDEEWEALRSDLAERIKPGMYRALGRIIGRCDTSVPGMLKGGRHQDLTKLAAAVRLLEQQQVDYDGKARLFLAEASRRRALGELASFAREVGETLPNLTNMIAGRRRVSRPALARFEAGHLA